MSEINLERLQNYLANPFENPDVGASLQDLDSWPGKPGEIERGAHSDSGEVVVEPALGGATSEVA